MNQQCGGKKQEILLSDCGWTQEKHGRITTEWGNEMEDEVSVSWRISHDDPMTYIFSPMPHRAGSV